MTDLPGSTPAPVPAGLRVVAAWAWRLLLVAVAIALLAIILYELRVLTLPIFIALLLTTLLRPPVRRLTAAGVKPALATAMVFLSVLALVVGGVYLLASPVASQFRDLGPQIRAAIDNVAGWLRDGPLNLSQTQIDRYVEQATTQVRTNSGLLTSGLVSSAVIAAEVFAGFFLTLVLTFFFLKDGDLLVHAVVSRLPSRHQAAVRAGAHRAFFVLGGYLRGVALTGLVDAVLIGIALFAISVPLLWPLVILTFLGAFFPVVGATVAGAIAALVALVNGGAADALLVLTAVVVVQQLEGHILQPLVVGRAVRLHPVVIISALTSGGIIAGLLGAFLAVPLTAMAVGVFRELEDADPEPDATSRQLPSVDTSVL